MKRFEAGDWEFTVSIRGESKHSTIPMKLNDETSAVNIEQQLQLILGAPVQIRSWFKMGSVQ